MITFYVVCGLVLALTITAFWGFKQKARGDKEELRADIAENANANLTEIVVESNELGEKYAKQKKMSSSDIVDEYMAISGVCNKDDSNNKNS